MAKKVSPKEREREFIIECIRLYRDLPVLWNSKSKEYQDRNKKMNAYKQLLSKYQEMYYDATKDDLKKKLNALRTNYRKELKKYVQSIEAGNSTYVPVLWYFNEMNFLYDVSVPSIESSVEPKQSQDSSFIAGYSEDHSVEQEQSDTEEIEEISNFQEQDEHFENEDMKDPLCSSSTLLVSPKKTFKKIRKLENNTKANIVSYDLKSREDEYYHWAMSCAADLRKMETKQQVYAKRAIAEILMQGQLGQLKQDLAKVNETHHNY